MKGKAICLLLICLIITTALVLTSCGNSTTKVVEEFLAAEDQIWNTGNGDALLAIEDPDIVVHMFGMGDMTGNTAHRDAILGIRNSIPGGVTHVWDDITGSGDIGAFRYTESFMLGDSEVEYQGCMFLHIQDGKVIEIFAQYDSLTLMLAYGVVQYVPQQ
jgi:ketosteroid isomerase-like protein